MKSETRTTEHEVLHQKLTRRRFLQTTGMSGAARSLGGSLAACKSSSGRGGGSGSAATVKIGFVSPKTGTLAPFGEADDFVIAGIREQFSGGLTIAGKTTNIQIITKDSQSDPNRAAQVASDLISGDKIDLMVVESTPETTNPVSGQ